MAQASGTITKVCFLGSSAWVTMGFFPAATFCMTLGKAALLLCLSFPRWDRSGWSVSY